MLIEPFTTIISTSRYYRHHNVIDIIAITVIAIFQARANGIGNVTVISCITNTVRNLVTKLKDTLLIDKQSSTKYHAPVARCTLAKPNAGQDHDLPSIRTYAYGLS